jgi:hypothetical protein
MGVGSVLGGGKALRRPLITGQPATVVVALAQPMPAGQPVVGVSRLPKLSDETKRHGSAAPMSPELMSL